MAGPARYSALIDACALHPFAVADALMSVYRERLCQIKWTRHIEEEWLRSVTRDRPELGERLPRRRDMMRLAVTDWEVPADAYEPLMPALRLPDPNDVHVLAAAIAGHVDCIVTFNLRDFPLKDLQAHGLVAIHPDDFLIDQWELDEVAAMRAFRAMRARRRKPPISPEEFVEMFERNGLAATAVRLRTVIDFI